MKKTTPDIVEQFKAEVLDNTETSLSNTQAVRLFVEWNKRRTKAEMEKQEKRRNADRK